MRKSLLLACVAVTALGLTLDASAKGGKGDGNNRNNNNNKKNKRPNQPYNQKPNQNQNPNQTQTQTKTQTPPSSSPFSTPTDPTQIDSEKKKVESDREAVTKAEKELAGTAGTLRSAFESSADRQSMVTAARTAQ